MGQEFFSKCKRVLPESEEVLRIALISKVMCPCRCSRDGTREEMLGDNKNCQSANSEQSEHNFYGPHLSDWL